MKLPFWPNPKGYRDIDLGLKRVYDLLARLDNPHQKLPPTIHIAGTNGKGSTLAFLKAIFIEHKYLVHSYTSPHLVLFNERIVLANKQIDDKFLNECLKTCKEAALQDPKIEVTFFEGITVAAFLAFSKVKADILLLETGMGGRLDATNVIEKNLLTIITPISLDHTEFLGKTLTKIAAEKAGIIKKGSPVIVGRQKAGALKVIEKKALDIYGDDIVRNKILENTILVKSLEAYGDGVMQNKILQKKHKSTSLVKAFGKNFIAKINDDKTWTYQTFDDLSPKKNLQSIQFPLPSLFGTHQLDNAATAINAALTQQKLPLKISKIKLALQKTIWPARLQKIKDGKFFKILPDNFDLFLDGSHNVQGSKTIKQFLKSQKYHKKFIIFAMLKDKNCQDFLSEIKDEIDELMCLEIKDENKSMDKEQILEIAKNLKINSQTADNFKEALVKIINKKTFNLANNSKKQNLVLICGSLYLAGEFLKENK